MNGSIDEKELERLLQIARAAGDAEGYARAKFEMAVERAKGTLLSGSVADSATPVIPEATKPEKLESLEIEAQKIEDNQAYRTRMTVAMTRATALDYIKSVAPRIVGPAEIKKNSEKNLDVFISYGTLARAMADLVKAGEVEQLESSRWRYTSRAAPLRSIK